MLSVRLSLRKRRWLSLAVAAFFLIIVGLLATTWGAAGIPVSAVVRILMGASVEPATWETIIFQIRIPRIVLGGIVGMTLAIAGAVYQAIFRNPLADPYLLGVSSGASFGAAVAIYFVWRFSWGGLNAVSIAAFGGALLATATIYSLARVGGKAPVTTLILAGVAIGALLSSATTFLMFTTREAFHTINLLGWLMGSLALADWTRVKTAATYIAIALSVIAYYSYTLNVLQLDEDQAMALGVEVERVKFIIIAAASLATAAAVSVSGVIGFLGIIIPHTVRILWGSDYRFLLPMSGILGGLCLILADGFIRLLFAPRELPIGVVTAFLGAPFFIYLLRRYKKEVFPF
ncbi:MAG: iron ABC transporter permease [Anaerolineae bacterium]|nr:iron ABC transporter permease [Anaerolineae bacterium]MDW8102338.1 iron ABC transporter permease [Anaerolineae bacterium]